jgi:hypothetical protein
LVAGQLPGRGDFKSISVVFSSILVGVLSVSPVQFYCFPSNIAPGVGLGHFWSKTDLLLHFTGRTFRIQAVFDNPHKEIV